VKINYFKVIDSPEELNRPIEEIMTLFEVLPVKYAEQLGETLAGFPETIIYVKNQVDENVPVSVMTQVCFHTQAGEIKLVETSASAEDENKRTAIKRLVKINLWRLMHQVTGRYPGPWGILSGVRPTKIVHRYLDDGYTKDDIKRYLEERYLLNSEKAHLITEVAAYQRPWIDQDEEKSKHVSVYIGIPYCPTRCLYCSFPSYVLPEERYKLNAFLVALRKDILAAAELIKHLKLTVQTLYIGGGTPTSLDSEDFEELLSLATASFIQPQTKEFTVEAGRPDSISDRKVNLIKQYGVSRVSVNPQTMQEKTLKRIGRMHTVEDIINIFGKIRYSGIPIINMDMITGLPGETVRDVQDTLEKVIELNPENITVHTLALKKGSMLKMNRQNVHLPDETVTREMLKVARVYMASAGMLPYYLYRQKYMTGNMENVGYTKPGRECIYNIQIMEERQTIIGIGPNAATKAVNSAQSLKSTYFPKDIDTYNQGIRGYIQTRRQLLEDLYGRE
jgi:oxygen-independent coproporphyrinogen-3 oxidase